MALQKVLVSGLGLGWREEVGPSSACRGLEGTQERVGSGGLLGTHASWKRKWLSGATAPASPKGSWGTHNHA